MNGIEDAFLRAGWIIGYTMKVRSVVGIWFVSLGIFLGVVWGTANQLPMRVATHFDGAGRPNGWMSHDAHLTFMTCFGVLMALFIAASMWSIRFFPARSLNVPNASYWRSLEHFPEACAILLNRGIVMSAATLVWLAGLGWSVVVANRTQPAYFNPWLFLPMTAVYLGFLVVWSIGMIRRFRRIP